MTRAPVSDRRLLLGVVGIILVMLILLSVLSQSARENEQGLAINTGLAPLEQAQDLPNDRSSGPGHSARVSEPSSRPAPPGPFNEALAPTETVQIRVVAAENGDDLRTVSIVKTERPDLSRAEHPGSFVGMPLLVSDDSPLALPKSFELWDRLAVLAPGRAATFISLDRRTSGDRSIALQAGADLEVELEGFEESDFAERRLHIVLWATDEAATILVDRPADLGPRFRLENLPAVGAMLSIESYPIGRSPALARSRVDLNPGARNHVVLARLPDPPRIPLSLSLALPSSLAACDWLEGELRRVGGPEAMVIEADVSRPGNEAGDLSCEITLPAIGDWEYVVEGRSFPFTISAQGAALRFELDAPAPVRLRLEGGEARRTAIRWRQGEVSGQGIYDPEQDLILLNPRPGLIEVEIETDDGIQYETIELPEGGLERTLTLRPATSFWIGATFESIHVQLDIEDILVIERLDGSEERSKLLMRDPFRCRVALAEAGRYRLALRRAPAGYRLPDPLICSFEAGTKSKLAFVLDRQR